MSNIQKGILLFIIAWTFIPIMDGLAKYLSATLPVIQIVWARYFFTCILIVPIIINLYGKKFLFSENYSLQIYRGSFLVGATICFFFAISVMPLAEALALAFVYPLFIILLSPFLLKERVDLKQFLAVIIGFAGILFIIKPGFREFNIIYILPLGTGLFYSLYMIFTSKLVNSDTPFKTLAFTGLVGLLSMSLLQPFVWVGPTIYEWILMLAMGTVAAVGHFLIILSFRFAKASVLAPFSYWEILTNIIIGYYFFGNIPDNWSWLGIVIIIGSGIYILVQSRTPRYEK